MPLSDQIIQAESGGNPNAANPNSSAVGLGQFTTRTWNNLIQQYRPDLAQGKSPAEIAALRTDPDLSRAMVGAYAGQNADVLTKTGVDATPGNLYLAHFAGPGGAVQVLKADPATPVGSILGEAVVKANPFLAKMSAGQLAQWASGRLGGGAPQQVAVAAPAAQPAAQPQPSDDWQGLLSGGGAAPASQFGAGNGMLNVGPAPASPAPPAPPPLQINLPQGTLASQLFRARLLASIFGGLGGQQQGQSV